MGDVHQNLPSHLKLNLVGLPHRRITEEELFAAVVRPFVKEVEKVQSTIVKKIWRDVIVPCEAMLITLGLFLLLGWALKMGKFYAMKKYVERYRRRRDEKTAAAAALQLSNFDGGQEEGILQQESAKNSSPTNFSQRETSSKKSLPKRLFGVINIIAWCCSNDPICIYLPFLKSDLWEIPALIKNLPRTIRFFPLGQNRF